MRFSKTLIPTLKENPVEAQIVSHRLMLRAGLIRQLSAGIYTWLPLGLRVLRKVEAIVRQEMDNAGAQEIFMPAVQPGELWQESGRWDQYGPELLRMKDRHERAFCFGPTHEEVISDLVRQNICSYKQLPANFYQIQTKFRDEIRPRFGIMRGREFLMKDAYSFDLDAASLDVSYQTMFETYQRIFQRCGLAFRAVEADTGTIGGASSHEFHVLAESGEDSIVSCTQCDYAANLEKAVAGSNEVDTSPSELADGASKKPAHVLTDTLKEMVHVATPGQKSIEDVAQFLKVPVEKVVKSLLVETEQGPFMLLLRGDHALNLVKAAAALNVLRVDMSDPEHVFQRTGVPAGSVGPIATPTTTQLPLLADREVQALHGFVCGANKDGWHLQNVHWARDLPIPAFADLRNVTAGEPCPRCTTGHLQQHRGIEVGHVFKLGDKYTRALGVRVLDSAGKEKTLVMGCYGIGVSRIVAATIEQHHDQNGILWPSALAPFQVELLLVNTKDAHTVQVGEDLYQNLRATGIDVLLDDRNERLGVKFKDADLLGCPLRVLVGGRSLKEGVVEIQFRKGDASATNQASERILLENAADRIQNILRI